LLAVPLRCCAAGDTMTPPFVVDLSHPVRNDANMEDETENFSVKVSRKKDPPWPYVWEIYRGAERTWIRRSMHGYASREKASEAGRRALSQILEQRTARGSR
jgi:hypothetical protein